jgi:hypothetical protein
MNPDDEIKNALDISREDLAKALYKTVDMIISLSNKDCRLYESARDKMIETNTKCLADAICLCMSTRAHESAQSAVKAINRMR